MSRSGRRNQTFQWDQSTESRVERAILVQIRFPDDVRPLADALQELRALTESAGGLVVGEIHQARRSPDKATFIGKGKVEELRELCEQTEATLLIFGHDLAPAQARNVEEALQLRVVDRSQLIMDLFALRARTRQARLQVEMAQLQYSLPRLKRLWTHLDRYKGGIGMRGPGETQIESDRREIRRKISELQKRLQAVERHRELHRASREGLCKVGLIGYTNAGKSTLFNRLTAASVDAENRPFSTLDTRTRQWKVGANVSVLLSDTIGFVRDLPHHLIASFHATLDEALQTDLVLHVIDGSRPDALELVAAVEEVLMKIGADKQPRQRVINKTDAVSDRVLLGSFGPDAIAVSAKTGDGLDRLEEQILEHFQRDFVEVELVIPPAAGATLAEVEASRGVLWRSDCLDDGSVHLRALLPAALAARVARFRGDVPSAP